MIITALLMTLISPLPAQASKAATAAAEKAELGEKLVCKRIQEIGKLASRKRVCLTPDQWDQVARQGQELGRSMQSARTTPDQ